ncbi:MAG: peptide MFS transporter [Bacteroidales bacterium]
MFKGHPRGLIAAALANMGERYGFYTMMAILALFITAKFGLDGTTTGYIYATFYALIYILSLAGGAIADKTRNYKGTIMAGIIVMSLGYLALAIPSETPVPDQTLWLLITLAALFIIAFGNGLFKGNLQALVGQMYDNEVFGKLRDSGFSIFYMFINIGAIFAPFTAVSVRNWWLSSNDLEYSADLPKLCHAYLKGTINPDAMQSLQTLANDVTNSTVTNIDAFARNYLDTFVTGFHYAFGVAIFAMLISLVIYMMNKKYFPDPRKVKVSNLPENINAKDEVKMDTREIRQRMYALFAVFGIVIFFWFSFHQNGLTLTFFARDYTRLELWGWDLSAEIFQSMNPFFVVFLTPIIVGLFGWLRARGMEPSTPKKIAIGMFIAALAFVVMVLGSLGLPLYENIDPETGGTPLMATQRVSPFLLIGTYFILTVAELFISPLGISFVSKVSPPQYQGIMQGGWLGATALGNQLLFIGAILYQNVPIWMTWGIFVIACVISMLTMIFMLRWLERVSK